MVMNSVTLFVCALLCIQTSYGGKLVNFYSIGTSGALQSVDGTGSVTFDATSVCLYQEEARNTHLFGY